MTTCYRLFLLITVFGVTFSSCQNGGEKKVAYVLNQKIFDEFNGTKEIMKKLKAEQEQQGKMLDSVGMAAKSAEISKDQVGVAKNNDLYRNLYNRFSEMNKGKMQKYSEDVWKQINQYIADYGKQEGYDFIYGANGTGTLMYARQDLDITDKVLKFVNEKYEGK